MKRISVALALIAVLLLGVQTAFAQEGETWETQEKVYNVTLINPQVLCGIFIGVMLVFVFCALTMNAVGRAAYAMMGECRRQFGKMREAYKDFSKLLRLLPRQRDVRLRRAELARKLGELETCLADLRQLAAADDGHRTVERALELIPQVELELLESH